MNVNFAETRLTQCCADYLKDYPNIDDKRDEEISGLMVSVIKSLNTWLANAQDHSETFTRCQLEALNRENKRLEECAISLIMMNNDGCSLFCFPKEILFKILKIGELIGTSSRNAFLAKMVSLESDLEEKRLSMIQMHAKQMKFERKLQEADKDEELTLFVYRNCNIL